jgi:hypothetical protein
MEKPCYKCGQSVEEGVPFCLHCSAPQIRVVIAGPPPNASASIDAVAVSPVEVPQTLPGAVLSMRWSHAIQPCALAALVATVLMVLGLNTFVAMLGTGLLAVIFYRQRRSGIAVKALSGARLGALSGVLCFGMASFLAAIAATSPDVRAKVHEQVMENAKKWAVPPAQMQAALDQLKTPEGLVMVLIVAGIFCIVVAGLGGALGGAILGRRDKS